MARARCRACCAAPHVVIHMPAQAYNGKHNSANGEDNRDGSNDNFSWNCGAEGATSDAGILALRDRQMRNMMVALMVSQGTPMMVMGERGPGWKGVVEGSGAWCVGRCARRAPLGALPLALPRCPPPSGDELIKTHNGNNNWYGHNADWTYQPWSLDDRQQGLLRFCSGLIKFRKEHPLLGRAEFVGWVAGCRVAGSGRLQGVEGCQSLNIQWSMA